MKRILLIGTVVLLCLLAVVGTTAAFLTREDSAVNVITMGNLKIGVDQTAIPPEGGDPVPYEGDGLTVVPGKEYSWIFRVENCGNHDAFIRVAVNKIITLAEGKVGEPDPDVMCFHINEEYWELSDGYYYYKQPLTVGAMSEPLFTAVHFDFEMSNVYQGSLADAEIKVSATQVANNGESALLANGWIEG